MYKDFLFRSSFFVFHFSLFSFSYCSGIVLVIGGGEMWKRGKKERKATLSNPNRREQNSAPGFTTPTFTARPY